MGIPNEASENRQDAAPSTVAQPAAPPAPFWLRPMRFTFQLLRFIVVVALVVTLKAAGRQGGPAVTFSIAGAILAICLLSWLISKGLALLASDAAREKPSRKLATVKLALGVPLVYLLLVGLNPEWPFGLLPAGWAGPLHALAYSVPIAVGTHCLLMGSCAWADSRPPVWLRALIALAVVGLGAALGPAASEQYRAYERSVGKLPLYVSDYGQCSQIGFLNKDLILIDDDAKVERWRFGQEVETLRDPEYGRGYWMAEFSPDGRYFAWRRNSEFGVFDLTAKKNVLKKGEYPSALAIDHESKIIAVARTADGMSAIELWDLATAAMIRSLPIEAEEKIVCLGFHPGGKRIYSASEKGAILVQDAEGGKPKTVAQLSGSMFELRVSPDGQLLAVSGVEPGVVVLNADTGDLIQRFMGHGDASVNHLVFSSKGRQLFSVAGVMKTLVLAWDARSGMIYYERRVGGYDNPLVPFALSANDKLLATGGDYQVRVWDVANVLPND